MDYLKEKKGMKVEGAWVTYNFVWDSLMGIFPPNTQLIGTEEIGGL